MSAFLGGFTVDPLVEILALVSLVIIGGLVQEALREIRLQRKLQRARVQVRRR